MYEAIVSIFQEILTSLHLQFTLFTLSDHVLLGKPFNLFSYIFFFSYLCYPASGFFHFHKQD